MEFDREEPDDTPFGNEFGKRLEKREKKERISLARCRNFEWKMDERRIRAVAAAHPSSFVFMRA